jgi:hypothetical protein
MARATHRPQLARCTSEQRVVHRKRQERLVASTAQGDDAARAQCIVEVGRVHLRALARTACAQPGHRIARTAPCLHERAIARAVLKASSVEAIVQRCDVGRA